MKTAERLGRRLLFRMTGLWDDSLEIMDSIPSGTGLRRIMIMRQDRIGDMVMTLPLLRALRRAHPGAELTVVTSPGGASVLRHEEQVGMIVLGKRPLEFLSALMKARKLAPDAAVDMHMHDSTTSFLFTLFSGASWRLHVDRENRLPFNVRVRVPLEDHVMDSFKGLLEGLGEPVDLDTPDRSPRLSSIETEFAGAFWKLSEALPEDCVCVNISAGGENRWWGTRNYSELCIRLLAVGYTPLVLHEPAHAERARNIARSAPGTVLSPPTASVLHSTALMDGTALVISPDTSIVHIAASLGIPVCGMYLPPEKGRPNWLPWSARDSVIFSETRESLLSIQPSELFETAMAMLPGNRA